LAEGAKRSSIKLVRGGRGESGKGSAYVVVHGQASQIEVFQGPVAFFDDLLSRVGSLLEMFPNIRLVVQPVPPRDYIVEINDERYPATESGLYGVAPGTVKVRVLRGTKPPCSWAGTVARGADQVVSCNL
jgi:hypothetical protein